MRKNIMRDLMFCQSLQVQHACLPQAMLGTDVLCQVPESYTKRTVGGLRQQQRKHYTCYELLSLVSQYISISYDV